MDIKMNDLANSTINNVDLKILESGYAISGREWKGNPTKPTYSRLYYIIAGDPFIIFNNTKYYLKNGYVYLMPAGFSYEYGCDSFMEQLYFHVNLTNLHGYDLLNNCPGFIGTEVSQQEIDYLISIYQSKSVLDSLTLKQNIYYYIMMLLERNNFQISSAVYSPCVQKAMNYIEQKLSMQLNVHLLAQQTFASESNLSKKFKNETGVSIGKYIDDLVLFKAEELLKKSNMSIMQISESLGFCDQFYFSRKFKSKFGITPQKYRQQKHDNNKY